MVAVTIIRHTRTWYFKFLIWVLVFIGIFLAWNLLVVGSGGVFGKSTFTVAKKVWFPPTFPMSGKTVVGPKLVEQDAKLPDEPKAIMERGDFEKLLPDFKQVDFAIENAESRGDTFIHYTGKLRADDKVFFLYREKIYEQFAAFRLIAWELKNGTLELDFERETNFVWFYTILASLILVALLMVLKRIITGSW